MSPLAQGEAAFLTNTHNLIIENRLPQEISPLNRELLLGLVTQSAPARVFADSLGSIIAGNVCRSLGANVDLCGPDRLFVPFTPKALCKKKRVEVQAMVDQSRFLKTAQGNPEVMGRTLEVSWYDSTQSHTIFHELHAWMGTADGFFANLFFCGRLPNGKSVVRIPTVTLFELAAMQFCEPATSRRLCVIPEGPPQELSDQLMEDGYYPVEMGITKGKAWSLQSSMGWIKCAVEAIMTWSALKARS